MIWSRRRWLGAAGAAPLAACSGLGNDSTPPQTSESSTVKLPRIHRVSTPDNVRAHLVQDRGAPIVSLAVSVPAGSRHEPHGQAGLASVSAHMLREGLSGGSRAQAIVRYADHGASPVAYATPELAVLQCTVHRDDAPAVLKLMVANMREASMSDTAFEDVRREHVQQLRDAASEPIQAAGTGLLLAVHGVEPPSGLLPLGTVPSLRSLGAEDVRAWHEQRIQGARLRVSIAGDVSASEATDWVASAAQDWTPPANTATERDDSASPPTDGRGPQAITIPWPRSPQAILAVAGVPEPVDYYEAQVHALATNVVRGLLTSDLRHRLRATYAVRSASWFTKRGPMTYLATKVDPEDIGRAAQRAKTLLMLQQQDIARLDDYLAVVRRAEGTLLMDRFHGSEQALSALLTLAEYDLPADYPERLLETVQGIRPKDVADVLQHAYHPDRVRFCIVGDDETLEHARSVLGCEDKLCTPAALVGADRAPDVTPSEADSDAEKSPG